ncbi:TPA: valine--tRNA ligase [Candidatus Poribacteria bacterium]|nr:valine--tRNA ligase [Candidatus Poribacteria bacterium]
MTEIPKIYEPKNVEQKWYSFWMEKGYFHAEDVSDKPPYSIVIPPPNITGPLHKGHAVPMTIQDILIRWKRMQGYNTLWMPGTDHAGISANAVVDRQLRQQGIDRFQLGREKFIEKMWEWKHYIHKIIINGLHRLGCSCDWERERFTMDEGLSKAVTETFVRLYNKGLIYRSQYIVNWCPRDRTTLSNLEVDYKEQKTSLYYVKYPFVDGEGGIVVATTRPETMLGDTAVAVHPSDERYKSYIGKKVILPIVNREIPIIADALHVDPEFGTGAVKITPGHDFNDFEVAQRHNIPSLNIMNEDATMNENAGKFNGMDRFECRKALLKELEEGGYLVKIEEHDYMLGKCSKCDTIVEPRLSLQWFVKMKPLAEPAIKAVESGEIRIIPESWTKIYYEWMYNIRDWPISRQIWWGHQIPVWYCKDCDEMIVATSAPEKCKCGSTNLEQDPDVLDTWFSSGLWPFSTLGWPEETQAYKTFYPTSTLVTAWDILFFWVARMIFQGIGCTGKKPFSDVYLHPLIADPESGTKMSKSKGNVQDLLDDIEKFGTDAFRFAIAASIIPSSYMMLPDSRIQGYRNFANKLWNASRFVLMNLDGMDTNPSSLKLELCDRWILSRYNSVIQEVTDALSTYRFNDSAQILYDFVWHEFCDWYLELAKIRIYDKEDVYGRQSAQYIVWKVLEGTLRLLHPIMPFITEEIWQHLPHEGESIMIAPWPKAEVNMIDKSLEKDMTIIMDIIRSVRNILSEMNVPPSKKAEVLIQASDGNINGLLIENLNYIYRLANASKVIVEPVIQKPSSSATAVVGEIEIYVPLAGLIDVEKEKDRLTKSLEKAIADLERINVRLSDESFLSKAPENIINKERERKADIEALKIKLEKNLEMLGD